MVSQWLKKDVCVLKKLLNVQLHTESKVFMFQTEMDVLAVYDAMQEAIEHARSGKGPVLVEAVSYRWFGHSALMLVNIVAVKKLLNGNLKILT